MRQLIDHLWQSTWVLALVWLLAWLARSNLAALRLWMWRAAALKFLVPFALLHALGGWLGFPVRHSAIAPPAWLTDAMAAARHWASPAQFFSSGTPAQLAALTTLLALVGICGLLIARKIRRARWQHREEVRRLEADWNDQPRPLGFFTTITIASSALALIAVPMLAGAVHDRLERQAALAIDVNSLRSANIELSETGWRFGDRTEIVATETGVVIRKINLQDLVALVYGIGQFEVFGGALPWLESPHYDVRVAGPIRTPAIFDPYSLRQPVTRYLNQQFGVSIRVNGSCQNPCLNQESFIVERVPWTILDQGARKVPTPAAQ